MSDVHERISEVTEEVWSDVANIDVTTCWPQVQSAMAGIVYEIIGDIFSIVEEGILEVYDEQFGSNSEMARRGSRVLH